MNDSHIKVKFGDNSRRGKKEIINKIVIGTTSKDLYEEEHHIVLFSASLKTKQNSTVEN